MPTNSHCPLVVYSIALNYVSVVSSPCVVAFALPLVTFHLKDPAKASVSFVYHIMHSNTAWYRGYGSINHLTHIVAPPTSNPYVGQVTCWFVMILNITFLALDPLAFTLSQGH